MDRKFWIMLTVFILLVLLGLLLTEQSGASRYPPGVKELIGLRNILPGPAGARISKARAWRINNRYRVARTANYHCGEANRYLSYAGYQINKPNFEVARTRLDTAIKRAYACNIRGRR